MQNIIIDEEFKALLPALDPDIFTELESNIIQYGVRDPIVLWGDVLIDGHNRYAICQKHDLPFHTVSMEFSSREDVLIWIINNQIARRNLTPIQLAHLRGLHYRADRRIISNTDGKNQFTEVGSQNENQPRLQRTATRLADKYNVSQNTILRNSKMSEAIDAIGDASPLAKQMVLSGEVRIDKNVLESLSAASPDEISKIAAQIEDGNYVKEKPQEKATMTPFEEAIAKISGELFSKLKKQAKTGDSSELKASLRSYITMLEDLYRNL